MTGRPTTLYSDGIPVQESEYDPTGDISPVEAIVDAIAAVRDVDPTDVDPLYEYVDVDALNRLFEGDDRSGDATKVLGFTVEDLQIFVRGDGHIRVCEPARAKRKPEPVFGSQTAPVEPMSIGSIPESLD